MASPHGSGELASADREVGVARERDRIAGELQDQVIQRVFAVGLELQGTVAMTADPLVQRRVEKAISDLDNVVRIIRDAVFDLQSRLKDRGLRAGILHLAEQFSPVPDVAFKGPVDGTLHPATSAQLLAILAEAVGPIGQYLAPVLFDVTASGGSNITVIHAVPLPAATLPAEPADEFASLRDSASEAGIHFTVEAHLGGTRFTWHVPAPEMVG